MTVITANSGMDLLMQQDTEDFNAIGEQRRDKDLRGPVCTHLWPEARPDGSGLFSECPAAGPSAGDPNGWAMKTIVLHVGSEECDCMLQPPFT